MKQNYSRKINKYTRTEKNILLDHIMESINRIKVKMNSLFIPFSFFFFLLLPSYKCEQTPIDTKDVTCFGIWGLTKGATTSAATVAAHEGVAAHGVLHLDEGQWPHRDLARALNLEAGLLVEGHEEILAHEHGAAHVRQTAQVLQVAPHQDGPAALLPERAVHR